MNGPLATFWYFYLRFVINSGLWSREGSNCTSTINSAHLYPELIVCTATYLVLRIMEMGFCKWAKWKVNCSVLQPAIARWRRRGGGGGCLAGCANFYNGIFTSSFSCTASNLLCISASVSTWRFGLPASCYLLQMFKVSLFIIYTATVLDFVEVEHYIHNQAHNG